MRGQIFISYRRDDVPGDARGIRDELARKLGKSNIFMDVDNLLAGQRFDRELENAVARCDVLIAIIGPRWMDLLSEKTRGGERDYVRDEIAAALKRGVIVIPVLVGKKARMPPLPRQEELPEGIRDLVLHQQHDVVHESFGRDSADLSAAIDTLLHGDRRAVPWKRLGLVSAAVIVTASTFAGYWLTRPSLPDRPLKDEEISRMATSRAKSNAVVAIQRGPESSVGKKVDTVSIENLPTPCDLLAASPHDVRRPRGVAGIADVHSIDIMLAAPACSLAMRQHPQVARFEYQAGRVAEAAGEKQKALAFYRGAIEKGSDPAVFALGALHYHNGNYAESRPWLEKAAASGDGRAMSALGAMYDQGWGIEKDHIVARKWYEKAAALQETVAMTNLGSLYYQGRGVAQDYNQAHKWFEKAALLGNPTAMTNLARYYENVERGAPNYVEAWKWYEKAANLGIAEAMSGLGMIHLRGLVAEADFGEARKWFEKAASLGNPLAMVGLGVLYEEGQGINRDYERARAWYQKAANAGLAVPASKLKKRN
jgi:TPR repeat protein